MWKNPYKSPLCVNDHIEWAKGGCCPSHKSHHHTNRSHFFTNRYRGMGYYDVTVLEAALNQQNCTLAWFDARFGTRRTMTKKNAVDARKSRTCASNNCYIVFTEPDFCPPCLSSSLDVADCLSKQGESMVGLIIHIPTSPRWIPLWKGQHWFGILRLQDGAYVDLDSRLSGPVPFKSFEEVSKERRSLMSNRISCIMVEQKKNNSIWLVALVIATL